MSHRKRKSDDDVEWEKKKTKRKSKDVECLDDGKDTPQRKLESLHEIRDVSLPEDVDSTKRMDDVCDLIPEIVEGLDTAKTLWHRGCYQRFNKNLNRLKPSVESSHPTSPEPFSAPAYSHPPWKRTPKRSLENLFILFPPDKTNACFVKKRQ